MSAIRSGRWTPHELGSTAGSADILRLQTLAGNSAVASLFPAFGRLDLPSAGLTGLGSARRGPPVAAGLQREEAGGGGGGPGRKHTFKLPEFVVAKEVADLDYGKVKELKLGGEYSLEPVGGGEDSGKGGVVLGPGETGIAVEGATHEIRKNFVPGINLKAKGFGTATTKELSFGGEADFEGSVVTTEVKLSVAKLDVEHGDYDILPLTFTNQFEKFFELPGPITLGGRQYKVGFKPLVEWTLAAQWSKIGREIAERIGPEALAEGAMTFGLLLVALGVVAGTAYELYYADEYRELPGRMYNDVVYGALASAHGIYGDSHYKGEPFESAYANGQAVRKDLEGKLDPLLLEQVLHNGVRKDVNMLANQIQYDALKDTAAKRAVATWVERHSIRASIIGVPGSISSMGDTYGPKAIEDARSRVGDYIRTKVSEFPL